MVLAPSVGYAKKSGILERRDFCDSKIDYLISERRSVITQLTAHHLD